MTLATPSVVRLVPLLLLAVLLRAPSVSAQSETTYAEAFDELHTAIGDRYPCFDLKGIDWAAVGDEFRPRVATVTNDETFGLLCRELVAQLQDNHAHLLPGTAPVPSPSFPRFTPGFACLEDDRGRPVVYWVAPDATGLPACVRPGLAILEVDGRPAREVVDETMRAIATWSGYSSDRPLRYDAMRGFLAREDGTVLTITAETPDGVELGFHVTCAHATRYVPRLPVPHPDIRDSANMSWTRLDDAIGYIYVRRIRGDLAPLFDQALTSLSGVRGLIIDVRGNSGGGFDRREAFVNFDPAADGGAPDRPRFRGPIAVLVNGRCISAGEGWTSWFVARKRARLFGVATAGASSRKIELDVKGGLYKVRLPVKAYAGFLDRPIERVGLVPDVDVRPNAVDLAAGRDTTREAARTWLRRELGD